MDRIAAFGIGSTNFRYVAATPEGEFLTEVRVDRTRPRELAEQIVDAVGTLRDSIDGDLSAVGVSCTGLVDQGTGVVTDFDTPGGDVIPAVEIGPAVESAHDLPVALANDCNAAALGEWYYGNTAGHDTVVHLTFGTGIGGGVVENGQLLRGESARAAEFGLLPVAPEAGRESTGVIGAWEAFCSGRGIPAFARELADGRDDAPSTAQDVFEDAAAGDPLATECLHRVDRYNAAGVASISNAFNPGLITLGGGVALNNADRLLEGIDRHLEKYLFVDEPVIRPTSLGDDVGLYGAVGTVLDQNDRIQVGRTSSRQESVTD